MTDQAQDDQVGAGISFDHIALALHHPTDLWPVLAGVLGGRYAGRGLADGYGWTQLQFANGFIVEGIHPEPEHGDSSDPTNGFISEFIDKSGVGPHHLTFKVDNIDAIAARLRSADVDFADKRHVDPVGWHELLLGPNSGHGILVQLLDAHTEVIDHGDPPDGFPELGFDRPIASLARVVHAVRDLEGALGLFRDVLGGRVVATGAAVDGNHWVELGWQGDGRLRLLEGTHAKIAEWIGDRPGRARHLFFNFDEPEYVPGAEKVASGRWVVDGDDVLGTRLVLSSSAR